MTPWPRSASARSLFSINLAPPLVTKVLNCHEWFWRGEATLARLGRFQTYGFRSKLHHCEYSGPSPARASKAVLQQVPCGPFGGVHRERHLRVGAGCDECLCAATDMGPDGTVKTITLSLMGIARRSSSCSCPIAGWPPAMRVRSYA